MASSSDMTEVKRFVVSMGLSENCVGSVCVLYETINSRICGMTASEITEMKRIILSHMPCMICMSSQNVSRL